MALGLVVAQDLANAILDHYERGKTLSQTTQDKPLVRVFNENKREFAAGKTYISEPVQGAYMSDTPGFLQGYSEDDALNFAQAQNILRAQYPWKEVAANLIITHTELKKDGITITDGQSESMHSGREIDILTDTLENRIADFDESWDRTVNYMFWQDGSQDAKKIQGLQSLIIDNYNQGTTGGLNRATYWWWQNRALVGNNKITASGADQTLTRRLRSELRQLRRFGGKPSTALCGSQFIDALELEVQEKGVYTMEGFANEGKTDMGMAKIRMRGLGVFEYDPTMDDLGWGKRCVVLDPKRITLRPMAQEDGKVLTPERPYQYMVFLHTKTWTGALQATQLNCHGVYEVA
jgi:hypothetical protein